MTRFESDHSYHLHTATSQPISDLLSWLWGHITEVSILLGGIGSLAGYYFSHWKAELADPASLEKLRSYLDDSPWRTAYRHMLGRALNAADQFFGPPMSLRAYSVCLTLAFFYPIALFFLTWVLREAHTLGTLELLPKGWSLSGRITLFAGVLLAAGMFWALIIHSDRVVARVEGAMARLIPQRGMRWRHRILITGTGLLAGIIAYAMTGDITQAFTFAVAFTIPVLIGVGLNAAGAIAAVGVAVAGAFVVVFSFAGAFTGALSIAIAFAAALLIIFVWNKPGHLFSGGISFAVAVAIAVGGTGYLTQGWAGVFEPVTTSYFIFFFPLPLFNAVLDTVSWAVSRRLGREMLDQNFHRWGMIGFALLDFVLAVVFLIILAVLFGTGGQAIDQLAIDTTGTPVFDLDTLIAKTVSDPLGEGLWITLMLVSTLVPTAIHAFIAIGSVVQMRGRAEKRERWRNEADESLAENEGLDSHTCRKIAEHWLVDSWLPSVVLLLVLLAAGWFAWQASVLPDALLTAIEWGRSLVA